MDGTIADFEESMLAHLKERLPEYPFKPLSERVSHKFYEDYPEEVHSSIHEIYHAKGFYENLPPIEGAIDALKEMNEHFTVFICSTPLRDYMFNIFEKYAWIDAHLGKEWIEKIILTRDKTLIHGDYLIDDAPVVNGVFQPKWEHILFDQAYNRKDTHKRRLNWQNWRSVLLQ